MIPLVFVHGFMGGSEQWHLQDPLAAQRPLIRLDLPGFGKNAGRAPTNRIDEFADWALADLSARGIDRFDLLGHSMGGMIVQEMIRKAPDRVGRLILYGTGAQGDLPGRFETVETSMKRARADGAQATARRIAATWFLQEERAPEYPGCAALAEKSSLGAILAGLEAMPNWSGRSNLADIRADTLVLWGDRDRTYSWDQTHMLWQGIATCSLAVVPGCAHAVHLEDAPLFNQIIQRFLAASGR